VAIRATFTSRHGGLSTGPFAQRNLADHVGDEPASVAANRRALAAELNVERVVFMHQVHGSDVGVVDAGAPADVPDVDAIGRRGVQHGVVASALTALRDLDAGPLRAWLGPAICGACYEVPAAMQAEVAGVVPETLSTTSRGTAGLDLRRGVAAQLRAAGVTAVRVSDVCTAEDPAYFSYRRDGVTGRFAGVAVLG
jgi:polyphenol oxidase